MEWSLREMHENTALVVDMAEQRVIANWGEYPSFVGAMMVRGLPLCRNVSYNVRTEPVDGAAASPGQIGYQVIAQNGLYTGGTLTAYGRTSLVWTVGMGSGLEPLAITRPTRYLEGYAPADRD